MRAVEAPDPVRDRIVAAATRLFARDGVAGVSIQSVADAAGITKPTLVYHFGSKDGLRLAVLASIMDHWQSELPRLMGAATGEGPRLDSLLHALLGFFRDRPDLARLILREMLDRPDEVEAVLRTRLQPWTCLLTEAIRHGQQQGLLQAGADPEAFVVLVVFSAIGVIAIGGHAAATVSPEPSAEDQATELVRIARAALIARPPDGGGGGAAPHRPKEE